MRSIKLSKGKSHLIGELPRGCQLCIEGKKSVLFTTGICNQNCWYCTLSNKRYMKDDIWINEKLAKNEQDVIEEIIKSGSKGAGITGGEPTTRIDRVVSLIKTIKKKFGKNFHLHMYTCGMNVTPLMIKKLYEAGLDEIRIHKNKELVKEAMKYDWDVGMEVPVIPGKEKELFNLIDYLELLGVKFLNLNELEFSERNIEPMLKMGLKQKKDSLTAVRDSEETAMKALAYAKKNSKNISIHYCTAALKMNYQLRNRLMNRAKNIKKPFEKISNDGFLLKGVMFGGSVDKMKAEAKRLGIKDFYVSRNRINFSVSDAKRIAKKTKFNVAIAEEYPSSDPWDFELTPLN